MRRVKYLWVIQEFIRGTWFIFRADQAEPDRTKKEAQVVVSTMNRVFPHRRFRVRKFTEET